MSGDNSDGTTNIQTKLPVISLRNGYFKIMKSIYSPEMLYPRIKTFLRQFNPQQSTGKISVNEISAFFRSLFVMGLNPKESKYYWNLIFWTIWHDIKKFPMAITMVIYGYHFRRVTENNLQLLNEV